MSVSRVRERVVNAPSLGGGCGVVRRANSVITRRVTV